MHTYTQNNQLVYTSYYDHRTDLLQQVIMLCCDNEPVAVTTEVHLFTL